jgi:hypothetical protein
MTVTPVGRSSQSPMAELQRQLAKDEDAMLKDIKAKASKDTLTLDQNKLTLDATAISAQQVKESQKATEAARSKQAGSYL